MLFRSPASDPGDGLPFATKRASEAFPVTLYTSADCTDDCKRARELLNSRGIPFTEKMVQKQAEYDELKDLVGDAFVPSIKDLASHVSESTAAFVLERALRLTTTTQIKRFMSGQLARVAPNLSMMESK